MNADSSLFYLGFQKLAVSFRDSFYIDSSYYEAIKPLTAILVPVDLNQTDVHTLGTLNPAWADSDGMTIPNLPQHSLDARAAISLGNRVDSMVVDTGSMVITITNTLPYGVTDLSLNLDNRLGQTFTLLAGGSIATEGVRSWHVRLDSISAQMWLRDTAELVLHAIGEGGSNITIDSTRGLTVHEAMDTILTVPYYGIIPPQPLSADSLVDLVRQHRLYVGRIDTGTVTITAINETQLDDTIWVIFPSVTTQAGDTLISKQFVPAHSQRSDTTDLRNHYMRLTNTTPQRVAVRVRAISTETPDRQAFVNIGQFVRGSVRSTRIGFSTFEGELNNLELPFTPNGASIPRPPTGWDAVRCTTVDATVRVNEGISATANTYLNVETFLAGSRIAGDSLISTGVNLGGDTVEYHGLANLMNQYPDSISSSGTMIVSGPVTMSETDSVSLDVQLQAPFEFVLLPVDAPGEVQRVETPGIENIQGGNANLRIWNRLPVGGRVYLVVDPDSSHVLENSGFDVDTLADVTIPVSPIVDRRATGEAYDTLTVAFGDSLLELFRHPPFYTRLQISLPGSNGDTLIAHGSDYIRVQMIADLTYRVRTGGGN